MTFTPRFSDPRTREGELLWPHRLPEDVLKGIEERLGPFGTAGQHQQRPSPRGGGIVKRDNFRFYRINEIPQFDLVAMSVDASFKDTETSSFVAVQVWGRTAPNSYLLAQIRERLSFTRTLEAIASLRQAWPAISPILIEDKANGPAIINVLTQSVPGIIACDPKSLGGSKEARAEASAPLIVAGNIYVPDPEWQPWVEAFISEWCAVPTNAFWDQVDAAAQYLIMYGRAASFASLPVMVAGRLTASGDGYLK